MLFFLSLTVGRVVSCRVASCGVCEHRTLTTLDALWEFGMCSSHVPSRTAIQLHTSFALHVPAMVLNSIHSTVDYDESVANAKWRHNKLLIAPETHQNNSVNKILAPAPWEVLAVTPGPIPVDRK